MMLAFSISGESRMRKIFVACLLALVATAAFAQCSDAHATPAPSKMYFVFLNRAANAPTVSKEKGEEIQAGHMANIKRLYDEGRLVMAGPFMDDTSLRGIFVFKADTPDAVKEWISTDPAVKAGRLEGDIHPWTIGKGEIHHLDGEAKSMENFVMIVYRWGDKAKTTSQEQMQAAFQGHMKYQLGLYEAGKTEIGGPFGDAEGGSFVGVVIAHGNKAEGEKLAADDPVVQAGIARPEVHEWITAKGVLYH
jgi:uncharacterized protein YciI